jgi:ribonuclease P protein component
VTLITLKKRSDFLRLRGGRRCQKAAFILETKERSTLVGITPSGDAPPDQLDGSADPRFGFTISKKVGNAVVRNKIRRRLKHAIRELAPSKAQPGYDYVLVARRPAATQSYEDLKKDLARCFERVHAQPRTGKMGTTSQTP